MPKPTLGDEILYPSVINSLIHVLEFDGLDEIGHWPPLPDTAFSNASGQLKDRVASLYDALLVEHTSGLGVQWKRGDLRNADGSLSPIDAGVGAVPDNATTMFYVEPGALAVSSGASFPANVLKLATVVSSSGAIQSIEDHRAPAFYVPNVGDEAIAEILDDLETRTGTAEGEIDALQTSATAAQGDITTLQTDLTAAQTALTTAQTDITALQGESGLADYTIETAATFTITPTAKIAYTGTADATATIAAGATAGQSVELVNLSDNEITISASGLAIDGTTIAAGATAKWIWNDAGEFELAASGGSSGGESGGVTEGGDSANRLTPTQSWDAVVQAWTAAASTTTGSTSPSLAETTLIKNTPRGLIVSETHLLQFDQNSLYVYEFGSNITLVHQEAIGFTPDSGGLTPDGYAIFCDQAAKKLGILDPVDFSRAEIPWPTAITSSDHAYFFAFEEHYILLSESAKTLKVLRTPRNTPGAWEEMMSIALGSFSGVGNHNISMQRSRHGVVAGYKNQITEIRIPEFTHSSATISGVPVGNASLDGGCWSLGGITSDGGILASWDTGGGTSLFLHNGTTFSHSGLGSSSAFVSSIPLPSLGTLVNTGSWGPSTTSLSVVSSGVRGGNLLTQTIGATTYLPGGRIALFPIYSETPRIGDLGYSQPLAPEVMLSPFFNTFCLTLTVYYD